MRSTAFLVVTMVALWHTGACFGQAGPVLTAKDGKEPKTLSIAKADIEAVITGYIAQTTMVLTFRNDLPRILEGELVFPLPEGATVTGYGLDVGGELVDGVPVEKQKARVTFETEVRKGVDPGIVEHVRGNNFRTRVYPIPANGTRTIKVQYVSDLSGDGGTSFVLPLNWGQAVKECRIKVQVVKAPAAPQVKAGSLKALEFRKWEDRFVAEQQLQDVTLAGDVAIALPPMPRQEVLVEQRTVHTQSIESIEADAQARKQGLDLRRVEHYFLLADQPPLPEARAAGKPHRIGILWDATLSRHEADKTRELKLLAQILGGDVTVDLVVFRDRPELVKTFVIKGGGCDELIGHLKGLAYDGGTNLGLLRVPAGPDCWLLFTDGLGNLGGEMPVPQVPLYAISNDSRADHALLHYLSRQSGGAYYNLQRATDQQVLAGIGQSPFALLSVDCKETEVAEIHPRGSVPVSGQIVLAGKLLVPEASITLNYGIGGKVTHRATFALKQAGAAETGLVPRFWAQQKLAELSALPDKHEEELSRLGRQFNLVTPNTSLIVLERVEQYLEHRIVPPRSRPEVYKQFLERIETQVAQKHQREEQKIQQVLAMWDQRVKWWEKEYKYPADFVYKAPPEAKNGGGGAGATAVYDAVAGGLPSTRPVFFGTAGPGRPASPAAPPPPSPVTVVPGQAPAPLEPEWRSGSRTGDAQGLRRHDDPHPTPDGPGREHGLLRGEGEDRDWHGDPKSPAIQIKAWDPSTPYLQTMKAAGPPARERAYEVYLEQRKAFAASPAFYLDCGDWLLKNGQESLGIRVLSNIPELKLDDGQLLRIAGHRLLQAGQRDLAIGLFQTVLRLRPEEPQSHRDLALALADRADAATADAASLPANLSSAIDDYQKSLALLHKVVMNRWDRFEEIEVVALMEANRILARVERLPKGITPMQVNNPFDKRLLKLLDLDLRIVMTWDTDATDIDLWVTEPSREKCDYSHNRTTIGGLLSRDFTQGYGPEEYCLRKLMPGKYVIQANFYGSSQQSLVGPTTVQATVITNFGRPDEKRQSLTLRLADKKEVVEIGTVTLGGGASQ